jgi:hypothetical protein
VTGESNPAHEALRQALADGLAKMGVQLTHWQTTPEGIELRYQTQLHQRTMRILMGPIVEKLQDQTQIPLAVGDLVLKHAGIHVVESPPICCAWCSEPFQEGDETGTLTRETPQGPEALPIHRRCMELAARVSNQAPPSCEPCRAPLQERPPNPELKPAPGLMYCARCGGAYRV